jgi:iron complex transport system substrate-binding protein
MHPAVLSAFPPVFLALLVATGCGHDAPDETASSRPEGGDATALVVTDQADRVVSLASEPTRIVSLVPAATGILLALGEEERLVARTDYDHREELEDRPSVGGGLHPSLERILSLEPHLVIRFEGDQDRATPAGLERAGIPHLAVRPDGIADVRDMIHLLGEVVGRRSEAKALWSQVEEELDRVRERVAGQPRPRVAFLLGGNPPWVAGAGTFLHELVEIAGGRNAVAKLELALYAPVSVEELVAMEVDLVLILEGARIPESLREFPAARVPATVQSPGLGLAASARAVSRAIHPELWR